MRLRLETPLRVKAGGAFIDRLDLVAPGAGRSLAPRRPRHLPRRRALAGRADVAVLRPERAQSPDAPALPSSAEGAVIIEADPPLGAEDAA